MGISNLSGIVGVGNASQFTVSMWAIPPADGVNPSNFNRVQLVNVETDGDLYNRFNVEFNTSLIGGVTPTRGIRWTCSNFIFGDPGNKGWVGASVPGAYVPGVWQHLFIGLDTAGENTGFCVVNLADKTGSHAPTVNDTGFAATINGCRFGMPTTPASSSFQTTKLQMAEVQIWFGTFIAPTAANLAKFVKVKNGKGTPENPKKALAAFGAPTYRFSGKGSAAAVNLGNGGAVTLSGGINNFTPTASF